MKFIPDWVFSLKHERSDWKWSLYSEERWPIVHCDDTSQNTQSQGGFPMEINLKSKYLRWYEFIIFLPYKIMITTNYKISYFSFNFHRKSTYWLDRLEKLRGDRSPTSSGMIVSESIYAAVCGMCGMWQAGPSPSSSQLSRLKQRGQTRWSNELPFV